MNSNLLTMGHRITTTTLQYYKFKVPTICLLLFLLMRLIWRFLVDCPIQNVYPPSPRPYLLAKHIENTTSSSSTTPALEIGISEEEWDKLQKVLDWPSSDQEITKLDLSTSPHYTTSSIIGLKETHKVGEKIRVDITARDHNNNLKSYGGDYFLAKLYNMDLKASVYGEVVDHRNGTYSVDLLLPWEGQAQVYIELIHSSEAVQVLKKYWKLSFPRSHYVGHFEGPGPDGTKINEIVECNIKWGSDRSWTNRNCCCEYTDVKTGMVWLCEKPKHLSCDYRVYHEFGTLASPLTSFEKRLIIGKLSSGGVSGDTQVINVLPNIEGIGTEEKCRSGLSTPVPSGFYYQDVWMSLVCNTQNFSPPQMSHCLQNKIIHLIGDSTTRQWFQFFEETVPGMKTMDLHTNPLTGPVMAVELNNSILIHWRGHGYPIRFHKTRATDLHYLSNEIDNITGGRHVVVVFTFCVHLTFHPLTLYIRKVGRIRQAVVDLLKRAPETTVIIKSGNSGMHNDIHSSDWYTMQLNKVMMEMFSDVDGVIYMDVWQMTSCHYSPSMIHPAPVIVSNEIDMLLSFICPP